MHITLDYATHHMQSKEDDKDLESIQSITCTTPDPRHHMEIDKTQENMHKRAKR